MRIDLAGHVLISYFFYQLACFFYQLQGKIYILMQNWLLKAKQEEFTTWYKV